MGKLAPLHNLLSPVFFSAILLFTNFRDFPYIIRHVYDRLMHCISGHVVHVHAHRWIGPSKL